MLPRAGCDTLAVVANDPDIFRMQEEQLRGLEQRVEALRRAYDRYFLGLEKREPLRERQVLERELRAVPLLSALQSTTRFRFRQLLARYRTYCQRWDRIVREIEEGTYRRGHTTQAERLARKQAEAAMARAQGLDPTTGRPDDGAVEVAED